VVVVSGSRCFEHCGCIYIKLLLATRDMFHDLSYMEDGMMAVGIVTDVLMARARFHLDRRP
jgi:hypothetical protein